MPAKQKVRTKKPKATPPSFETVWAAMQEFNHGMDKLKERQEETARLVKENALQMDNYGKKVKELSNSFGRVIEYMIAPNLREKLREYGLNFPSVSSNTEVDDYENDIHFEIDIKLENGDKAMLVEVKAKLTTEDVKEHIEQMEKMRKYADLHGDKRKFLGAVAGVVITTNVKQYALKQGFYVIEPSGETFNIIPPTNKPKEW